MATEIKMMDGAVALVVRQDGEAEPIAQLTVFTDDSYPSGVLAIDGMMRIVEVDLDMFNRFADLVRSKGKTKMTCRCPRGTRCTH